ncbi:cytochrome d ubiquinol oxidase subunit II [Kribbella voronezhensis]|uniref:cytochrome d ubiquinol oxidase subunit II n=1 Tax=Kribbella voronezhensis TaxID=2512212 RepID=UPI001416F043|nr:cytochrome d ubiquinol oxidase subunit II [Kribbella voronezhensis]
MSSPEAADAAHAVARQHRRAQALVSVVYLGLPLAFLVVTVVIAVTRSPFDWPAVVFPTLLLALGWFLRRRQRYQVGRWTTVGAWFGGLAVLYVGFFSLVFDVRWLAAAILPAALVCAFLGALLGRAGQRALMVPLRPELAGTQYELVLPLRGVLLTTLEIGTSSVTVRARFFGNPPGGREAARRTYELSEVTGVFAASLSGSERLKFPIALPVKVVGSAGPALILQARGEDWVLPLGAADAVADFLNGRVSAAKPTP